PVPLLASLCTIVGIIQTTALGVWPALDEDYLKPSVCALPWPPSPLELIVTMATLAFGVLAFLGAYLMYVPRSERKAAFLDGVAEVAMAQPRPWSEQFPRVQALLEHKYYFDELYDFLFVGPLNWI